MKPGLEGYVRIANKKVAGGLLTRGLREGCQPRGFVRIANTKVVEDC
jgi:hypothetical protein